MTQVSRTVGFLSLFLSAGSAVAGSNFAGVYEGELGKLELEVQGDRVTGVYLFGGGCDFEPGRRVLDAELEGDVLVGQVTLCQMGASCEERVYPFLAIYDQTRGAFTTDIPLEGGCASQGTRSRVNAPARMTLSSVPDDKARRYRAVGKRNPKKMQRMAKQMIATGHERLKNSHYALAAAAYEVGLSYDETDWAAYMGLGLAQHHLGASQRALEALERSAALNPEYPDTWFNLACVYSKLQNRTQALQALTKAVQLGFDVPEQMIADPDLHRLLGEDPQFQQLVQQARTLQATRQR